MQAKMRQVSRMGGLITESLVSRGKYKSRAVVSYFCREPRPEARS